MPIMDGYEASLLISQYFKDKEEEKNSYEQTNCALIYALTADSSEETKKKIEQHPFETHFEFLNNNKEIKQILTQIQQNKQNIRLSGSLPLIFQPVEEVEEPGDSNLENSPIMRKCKK